MDLEVWKGRVSFMKKVKCVKYGLSRKAIQCEWNCLKLCSPFIKIVSRLFNERHRACKIVNEGFRVVVGNGKRVRLWEEIRWANLSLKEAFPRIYALTTNKVGLVKEFGRWERSKWEWKVALRRPVFNWELEQWNSFLACQDCISELAHRRIQIVSDSKFVVLWVNGDDFGNLKLVDLIYDIKSLLYKMVGVSITFQSRGSNSFADNLVKSGFRHGGDRLEWGAI
ncbi:hypothetical protein Ddye_026262 [Dipteronia dyeriana]|uniref:RNase H type-1 domain-containing protein n=1 Tax=Dipteronia dyeriana TaxID=168575 RepID=A0AAD9TLX3_9ROSI|nr:hypothetical protein Ddye_026262 [Dipteronia dyeriana]